MRSVYNAKLPFNFKQPVIFRQAFGTGDGTYLICPAPDATARSARKSSSVSPTSQNHRCKPASEPDGSRRGLSQSPDLIHLHQDRIPRPIVIPFSSRSRLVVKRSSPTSWILFPRRRVSACQPAQSSSASHLRSRSRVSVTPVG